MENVPGSSVDLVTRLEGFAADTPDRPLYVELLDGVTESGRLTAAELRDRSAAVAAALGEAGIGHGDVALLIATRPLEFLVGLFGCMRAGVIAAPISFPRRPEHLQSRLEPVRANAGAVAIVAGSPQGEAEKTALELLTEGSLPVVSTESAAPAALPPITVGDVAYLQYTSGSTSEPRGVIVTHANLLDNLEVNRILLGYDEDSVNVSWCPLTHDMGLIMGALPSVGYGIQSVLMPPGAFIRRPLAWLRAVDTYRGTHGYSPNFGYDLCVDRSTADERAAIDLSSVKSFVNGAEPVRRATRDRFIDAFAPSGFREQAHSPSYGLAEASVLVSSSGFQGPGVVLWVDAAELENDRVVLREKGDEGVRELCADGVVGPGFDARIVDPLTGHELPPDRVGELWLRGPSICAGYWNRPEATEEGFGGRLADDDGAPFMRTGDLAFMYDGELVICGRMKDLIVIRGRNLHPQDIEAIAEESHAAVRRGGSAAFRVERETGEELILVAEVDGEVEESEVSKAIAQAVLTEFEVKVHDVLLVGPQGIPKTSSGKKQRSATREIWRQTRDPADS